MKEKTFEELITEKRRSSINRTLYDNDIKELMQQVREATIAECLEVATPYFDGDQAPVGLICEEINNLPTDRIKLTS